jgi:hypothetical protein
MLFLHSIARIIPYTSTPTRAQENTMSCITKCGITKEQCEIKTDALLKDPKALFCFNCQSIYTANMQVIVCTCGKLIPENEEETLDWEYDIPVGHCFD